MAPSHFLRSGLPQAFPSLSGAPLPVVVPVTRRSSHPIVTPLCKLSVGWDLLRACVIDMKGIRPTRDHKTTRDYRRHDGVTLLPWSGGKPMAWDVTIPDTLADSHIDATSSHQSGSAANNAANSLSQIVKYADLTATHIFMPAITIETAGSWN